MDECNKIISSTKDIKQLLILDELQETNQMCCTENYSMIATDLCKENKLFFFFFYIISPTSNCSQLTKGWTQPAEDALKHQKAGSFYETMEHP